MKKIVVFSGAGVSQESGIPTYRDKGGIWDKYDQSVVVTQMGWQLNPQEVLDFHNEARQQMLTVEPNKAHKIIAELEKVYDVTVITQNIDNLHEQGGSTNVIHLHGEINKARDNDTDEITIVTEDITIEDDKRPHVVWFGESPLMIDEALDAIYECDYLIIIGTSLQISYTPGLLAQNNAKQVWCIDPNVDEINGLSYISDNLERIDALASDGMEKIRTKLI